MSLATLPANGTAGPLADRVEAIQDAMSELKAIRTFVNSELKQNLDYGTIPGCGDKLVLLLPGAQKIAMYFNTRARFKIERTELGRGHLEVFVTTKLVSRAGSKQAVAEGIGSATTMETKYRFRQGERCCPECGGAFIIKGRAEYGGGWVCFKKKGGCGAKFNDLDRDITSQQAGRVEVENIHDSRNTVLKIAKKRSLVDASISLGCMSELFTQDLDDVYDITPKTDDEPAADPEPNPEPRRRRQRSRPEGSREKEERRRKQEVNDSFKPSNPKSDGPALVWGRWAPRYLNELENLWQVEMNREGVPKEERVKVFPGGVNELINLVVTAVITARPNRAKEVEKDDAPGKRDPRKAAQLCADIFSKHSDWTMKTVLARAAKKQDELRAKLGMLDDTPDGDHGDMYDPDDNDSVIAS